MRVLIAALFALSLFASEPVDPAEAKTLTKALVSLQAARLAVVDATKRADAAMDAYVKALQSAAAKRPTCNSARRILSRLGRVRKKSLKQKRSKKDASSSSKL